MNDKTTLPLFGFIIAVGLVVSTYLVTDVIRDVRLSHQIIKVRGYAEKIVESDLAVWKIWFGMRSQSIQQGYPLLEAQKDQVVAFLKEHGVNENELQTLSVSISELNKQTDKGYATNEIDYYHLEQTLEITSADVHKVASISAKITHLLKYGIGLHSDAPRYYYSKINTLKGELLTDATQDAQIRARTLAEGSGVKLGFLRAARQGNFSIHSANETNISSEERYDDTSSIAKKITAVVTVDYSMK